MFNLDLDHRVLKCTGTVDRSIPTMEGTEASLSRAHVIASVCDTVKAPGCGIPKRRGS